MNTKAQDFELSEYHEKLEVGRILDLIKGFNK